MEKIRAFVAIELPEQLIEALARVAEDIRKNAGGGGGRVSWTKPGNIHLTIKFLGDIDPEDLEKVREALSEAASVVPPFRLACRGVGGFPGIRRPRVIWVGLDDCPGLAALRERIEDGLAALGFERDERAFHPHLTLCRVKAPAGARAIGRAAGDAGAAGAVDGAGPWEFTVESFVLMRSELSPKGARHTVLERIPLYTRSG
ncbi:MAG: RNA 2',3'-cyclic phosphodiesterase [Thermodesulfobacteriota bacterium]